MGGEARGGSQRRGGMTSRGTEGISEARWAAERRTLVSGINASNALKFRRRGRRRSDKKFLETQGKD